MHTNKINNKKYIGITSRKVNERWRNGNGYKENKHFWNAIEKYGWDNFSHEILIENISLKEAFKQELEFSTKYDTINPDFGYNNIVGSGGYFNASDEYKQKLSDSSLKLDDDPKFGKSLNIKTIESIKKNIDKKYGKENHKSIPVIGTNLKTKEVKIFQSAGLAAKFLGLYNNSHITACCKGKRSSTGGYSWKYQEAPEEEIKKKIKATNMKDGTIILFESIKNALKFSRLKSAGNIYDACKGRRRSAGGHYWEYV
jgi:hypothetical protein